MNEPLHQMQCEACRVGAPQVTDEELATLIREIPEWTPVTEGNVLKLQRQFSFNTFIEALAFTNKVGALAEQFGHHPAIVTEWGKVTVTWWTHKIAGLHKTDFIMAAKTDKIS